MRLTDRPLWAMAIAGAIAVGSVWGGLAVAQQVPKVPPSFAIVACAAATYAVVALMPAVGRTLMGSSRRVGRAAG